MAEQFLRIGGTDGQSARGFRADERGNAKIRLVSGEVATLQNAATGNGNGATLDVSDYGVVAVEIVGNFNARIRFVGSVRPGQNFYPIPARKSDKRFTAMSTTEPGIYYIDTKGLSSVQLRISDYVSGTISVHAKPDSYTTEDQLIDDLGVRNYSRSGTIDSNHTETVFTTEDNITIESLEFSGNHSTRLYIRLRGRGKSGEYESPVNIFSVLSSNGNFSSDISFNLVFEHKSTLFDTLVFDDVNNRFKLVLKKTIRLPKGGTLEVINTHDEPLNTALFCTVTVHI